MTGTSASAHNAPETQRAAPPHGSASAPEDSRILDGPRVADRVRIERDETGHPCKGTWPQFRGRTGTVVEINHDRKRPHLTEWAAVLASGPTERRTNHR